MELDIMPILSKQYRGTARHLTVNDFLEKNQNDRKSYKVFFEKYLKYLDDFLEIADVCEFFCKVYPFYKWLVQHGVMCEMVLADQQPINMFCGYSLTFLGIDILNQYGETIFDNVLENSEIKKYLNKNYLCRSEMFVNSIICSLRTNFSKDHIWIPYYVYHVNCD